MRVGDGVWGVRALYENSAFEDPRVGVCAKAATEETISQTLWQMNHEKNNLLCELGVLELVAGGMYCPQKTIFSTSNTNKATPSASTPLLYLTSLRNPLTDT